MAVHGWRQEREKGMDDKPEQVLVWTRNGHAHWSRSWCGPGMTTHHAPEILPGNPEPADTIGPCRIDSPEQNRYRIGAESLAVTPK